MGIIDEKKEIKKEDKKRVTNTEKIIKEQNLDAKVIWHDVKGATSADARASLGVDMSDIAKSIVFIKKDGSPVMVIILGHKHVDDKKLKALVGQKVRIAKPDQVLEHTGFEVGGVTPIGCKEIPIYIDKSILSKPYVHTSAGCSYATLYIKTEDLINFAGRNIEDLAKDE